MYDNFFSNASNMLATNGPKLQLCQLGPSIFLVLTNKRNIIELNYF